MPTPRREKPRPPRAPRVGLALAFLIVAPAIGFVAPAAATPQPAQPNIVLILSDDQRWDGMSLMPNVRSEIVDHGVSFSNAFVSNPLCCPSRSTILTGDYSHTTGVYLNSGPYGGFASFTGDGSTIATWLHDAGYHTGLTGKYLNGYAGPYVPPGWDRFVAIEGQGAYYDYTLSIDGVQSAYGSAPQDYSTDVLSDQAVAFIEGTDPAQPLFLYYSPFAPHEPATPAPRHLDAIPDLLSWRPPGYNENDVGDKPAYIATLPKLDRAARRAVDAFRHDQYRSLLAVDDGVGRIVDALQADGRLGTTVFLFMSDNGYLWAEHRFVNKVAPYEESIRVPLVVRYDALPNVPRTDGHLIVNVDIAPTLAELAGVSAPGVEGFSFVPFLERTPTSWRRDFLVEHLARGGKNAEVPTYCGIRSKRWSYVYYRTTEEELYDLQADPHQLHNLAGRSAYAGVLAARGARMQDLCQPAPPHLYEPMTTAAAS